MISLTLAEIARAVNGKVHGPVQGTGSPVLTVTGPVGSPGVGVAVGVRVGRGVGVGVGVAVGVGVE